MTKGLTMRLIPALMMLGFAGVAGASGFALQNQSGSANGNAFAGAAAAAEDASTIFFNPAGMTYLGQGHNISLSGTVLDRSIKFKNTGTTNTVVNNGNLSNGGDGGGTAFLPHGYWAYSIAPDVWVGVGVGPTFGNKTEYDKNFIGRNAGFHTEIEQININPSIAFKVNDMLSLGLGVNLAYADLRLKQGVPSATNSGYVDINGDAWGFGANIGAMFQLSPSTRVGLTYRSAIDFDIQGKVKPKNGVTGLAAGLFSNQNITADGYNTPGSMSLAVSQKLSDKWEMLGDITWTDWSQMNTLTLKTRNGNALGMPAGSRLTALDYSFKDSFRFGLGANYQYNDAWKLRFGVAYDQTPVNNKEDRTMTLPDSDRVWLSFGGKYTLSKVSSLDFGYSHIFFKDVKTSRAVTAPPANTALVQTINGEWNNNRADLLSVQYNHTF